MKKNLLLLTCLSVLFITKLAGQSRDTLTIGKGEFAISSNTYSFFQTTEAPTWNRSVYIYPKQALPTKAMGNMRARVVGFQMFRDVSRVATITKIPGRLNPKGNYKAKVYMNNTDSTDWFYVTAFDSALLIMKNNLVFDADIKPFVDTASGWRTFPLSKPLILDRTKNLAIGVEYEQDSGAINQIYWAYDSTHVKPGDIDTINYYNRFQFRFAHRPFSGNTPVNIFTGSNIRHPQLKLIYDIVTDVEELTNITKATLFPNPAKDFIDLSLESVNQQNLRASVSDVSGRIYLQKNVEILRGGNSLRFELSSLPSGFYLLNLSDGNRQLTKPFVKE